YDIVAGLGSLAATNYSFSLSNGTLTVAQNLLVVSADSQERTYGATNPGLTYPVSGFVGGDDTNVLSRPPLPATAADTNSPVGAYDITIAPGTLGATNYALSFTNATLTVDPATLTVTADDQSRAYGAANPELTFGYSGFVNGEDVSALAELPSVSTVADTN